MTETFHRMIDSVDLSSMISQEDWARSVQSWMSEEALLRHVGEGLEVALEQVLDEVADVVLGVPLGDVHHERLDHQRPRLAIDDLRMDGQDG